MKKMIFIMAALVVTMTVSAQKRGGVYFRPRTHVIISGGYSPYYSPYYNPWYGPQFYNAPVYHRPSKLDLQIADIKNDYSDRIWSVKHDKSMSGKERRQEVRQLKHDRDKAIMDAKINYHRRR
jgi:hypothetical protein